MEKRNYESEILDIVETKNWYRAKKSNDENLYAYIRRHKDTDENCRTIWNHIKAEIRNCKSEVLEIVEIKNWDRARKFNDKNLYDYVHHHKDTDENCRIIWNHVKTKTRDFEFETSEIIEAEDWDRAGYSNDENLYLYIYRHKDTDENCKIIWNHIRKDHNKLEVLEIIKTEDWDRARYCNDKNLYLYVIVNKDIDKNCRIIWEHIKTKKHHPYTAKDYLLYYFKYGKLTKTFNGSLYNRFYKQIKEGNQCCIDIRNLIIAANTFQDPVAIETLELIKNHLEKEGT